VWGHKTVSATGPAHARYGDGDFGNAVGLNLLAAELKFFDAHLRDIGDGYSDFIARLCVETDDGAVTCLTQGQQWCRFRDDPAVPEPLALNRRDCRCRWGRRRTPFRWAAASCCW